MLDLWSSSWTFLWKQDHQEEYSVLLSCHLCYSSCVFFKTILLNVHIWWSLFVNDDSHPLFFFADAAIFLWFTDADITSETVALDTPNNVAVFVTMLQLNMHQRSVLFQNQISLPLSDSFAWIVTQHNHYCTDMSTTECTKMEKKNIEYCQLKFFQYSQHEQILFLSFLMFPLLRPPSVISLNFTQ
jgi:hypothetical protein